LDLNPEAFKLLAANIPMSIMNHYWEVIIAADIVFVDRKAFFVYQ
jgi:hypothetical protein